jgi:hypothetical protein
MTELDVMALMTVAMPPWQRIGPIKAILFLFTILQATGIRDAELDFEAVWLLLPRGLVDGLFVFSLF